jgi:hypothetical protein
MGASRFARCLQGGGVFVYGGSVSIMNSQIYSNTASFVRADVQNFPSPDGNIADTLNSILACAVLFLLRTCGRDLKFPIAPVVDSCLARCLQGGGIQVNGGSDWSIVVTITNSSIYGNTARDVRAHTQNLPSPPWEPHVWLVFFRAAVSGYLLAHLSR